MIGEIAIAIKALDSAFVVVKTAIAKKKEVEDMAGEVGKFFTAKKKVEEHKKGKIEQNASSCFVNFEREIFYH